MLENDDSACDKKEDPLELALDAGDRIIYIQIDGRYRDGSPATDSDDDEIPSLESYPAFIRQNALRIRRDIAAKKGYDGKFMFGHEYILVEDVTALYNHFLALKNRETNSFGPCPERYLETRHPAFVQFTAMRETIGARLHVELHPDFDSDSFDFSITDEKLENICRWLKTVLDRYPQIDEVER